jgi:hypothetical protein
LFSIQRSIRAFRRIGKLPLMSEDVGYGLGERAAGRLRYAAGAPGAVGRKLNQVARAAHQTGRVEGLTTGNLRAMLAPFEDNKINLLR